MLQRTLLSLLLLATGWAMAAQGPATGAHETDTLTVADAYLDAYARFDVDALGAFLDEESTFLDPTTVELGGSELSLHGKEAVLKGLRSATNGLQEVGLHFEERFQSAGLVVAIGRLHYRYPAASIPSGTSDAVFDLRVVTVLRVADGKIRAHTDYTDFSGWRETMAQAQR